MIWEPSDEVHVWDEERWREFQAILRGLPPLRLYTIDDVAAEEPADEVDGPAYVRIHGRAES